MPCPICKEIMSTSTDVHNGLAVCLICSVWLSGFHIGGQHESTSVGGYAAADVSGGKLFHTIFQPPPHGFRLRVPCIDHVLSGSYVSSCFPVAAWTVLFVYWNLPQPSDVFLYLKLGWYNDEDLTSRVHCSYIWATEALKDVLYRNMMILSRQGFQARNAAEVAACTIFNPSEFAFVRRSLLLLRHLWYSLALCCVVRTVEIPSVDTGGCRYLIGFHTTLQILHQPCA